METINDKYKVMDQMIGEVKKHALGHYEDGGWDVVCECWSDKDIERYLVEVNAQTPEQAISKIGEIASVYAERQQDAINSAF